MICRPARPPGSSRSCTVRKNAGPAPAAGWTRSSRSRSPRRRSPWSTAKSSTRTGRGRAGPPRPPAFRPTSLAPRDRHRGHVAADDAAPRRARTRPSPSRSPARACPGAGPLTSASRRYFSRCASSSVISSSRTRPRSRSSCRRARMRRTRCPGRSAARWCATALVARRLDPTSARPPPARSTIAGACTRCGGSRCRAAELDHRGEVGGVEVPVDPPVREPDGARRRRAVAPAGGPGRRRERAARRGALVSPDGSVGEPHGQGAASQVAQHGVHRRAARWRSWDRSGLARGRHDGHARDPGQRRAVGTGRPSSTTTTPPSGSHR